jgi:hypothetical protein
MSSLQMPTPSLRSAMVELSRLAEHHGGRAAILGKGPSFAEFDPDGRHAGRFVVGLNEAALRARCDASFIIDGDILDRSGAAIAASGVSWLLTPRIPHRVTSNVGGLTIYGPARHEAAQAPWASSFSGRHAVFNLSTAEADAAFGPPIEAGNFSAPIVAELLARAGFRDILLAGVDGGTAYAGAFQDVEYKKLRSVQDSFDRQFAELRGVRDRHAVTFRSARCSEAFVLIGTEAEQGLATEVLKWSIESNTFLTVRYCEADSISRSMYVQGDSGTPFSFQRIFLPEIANRSGRGVYFDSDMLVFKDVYELFNTDMQDKVLLGCEPTPGRRTQFSVFLVDNERAGWDGARLLEDYRAGRVTYEALMKDFCFAQPKASTLPMAWNSLEVFEPGTTANIHFTDMGTQPWLSVYNPNAGVWCEALFQALKQRPAVATSLDESLSKGWVRPSLRWQVESGRADPWSMPASVKALDRAWLPPHVRLRLADRAPALQLMKWRLASRVRRAMQSRTYVRLLRAGSALRKVF